MALKAFKNGLAYPIKNVIKAGRDNNLEDAIRAALEEEADLPKPNTDRQKFTSSNSYGDRPRQPMNRPMPMFKPPQYFCQRCHSNSHVLKDCYAQVTMEGCPLEPVKHEKDVKNFEAKRENNPFYQPKN